MKILSPQIIDEIMFQLRQGNELVNKPTIALLDIPTQRELRGIDINISDNEVLLFTCSYDEDIPIGTVFEVIIPRRSIENYLYQESILKYVSVNLSCKIDYLPRGYSGVCLFDFPYGKPEILNKLAIYGEKKNYEIHDTLILTQRSILNRILEEFEKYKK